MAREKSSRKYQLTINNPVEHGFTHEQIRKKLSTIKIAYCCFCDEVGREGTPHIHIFIYSKNAIMFSTIQQRFYGAHIECAVGTCKENRDYIRKEGKYLDSDKKETNLIDTFEEYGEMPIERKGGSDNISSQVLQMIKDGYENLEIIDVFPSYMTKIPHLDKVRQTILSNKFANVFRKLEVTYIYGETETGKTRYVLETYGYENVYKITNYEHPFDAYEGQDVILFDEFRSSLPLKDMLQYLDGYSCRLPARYAERQACYTKVFLISNIPFEKQYINIQETEIKSWYAFRRRITKYLNFEKKNNELPYFDKNNIDIIESYE